MYSLNKQTDNRQQPTRFSVQCTWTYGCGCLLECGLPTRGYTFRENFLLQYNPPTVTYSQLSWVSSPSVLKWQPACSYWVLQGSHSCWEFLSSVVLSGPERTVPPWPLCLTVLCPLFCGKGCDRQVLAVEDTLLHFDQLGALALIIRRLPDVVQELSRHTLICGYRSSHVEFSLILCSQEYLAWGAGASGVTY